MIAQTTTQIDTKDSEKRTQALSNLTNPGNVNNVTDTACTLNATPPIT